MTGPVDPRPREVGDDPLERRLRHSLAARADDAPDARGLTERLVSAGAAGPARSTGWTALGTPLLAAACVAAIVGIVLAFVNLGHPDRDVPDAARSASPVPSVSASAPVSSPVVPAPGITAGPTSSPAATPRSSSARVPAGVRLVDLTWTSEDSGWALGSADCLTGTGRCTALLRTTDGRRWTGHPNTPFRVPGVAGCPAASCVTHIRFADDSIGYAFGPDALFLTVDGARSWRRLPGGADALETLDDNVIRVVSARRGCPGPCGVSVQTATPGSANWRAVTLPGGRVDAATVSLARTGSTSVLTVSTGTAAAPSAATVFTSADDGAHWVRRADPCRSAGSLITQNVTTAADRSVTVLCAAQDGSGRSIRSSTDGGVTFGPRTVVVGAGVTPSAAGGTGVAQVAAASARVLVGYADGGLYRSVDGGHRWQRVLRDTGSGTVEAPGFESARVARWVSPDRRTVWTTRDAGATWASVTF